LCATVIRRPRRRAPGRPPRSRSGSPLRPR
jgi:hypothetical protein